MGFVCLALYFLLHALKMSDICPKGLDDCSPEGLAIIDRWDFFYFATVLTACVGSITGVAVRLRRWRQAQAAVGQGQA